jgi:CRISPR type IV-associated protein Csf3
MRLTMQPMKITAYLLDGRIAGTEPYFPLDSILAAEWIRRQHPESYYEPPPPGVSEGWIEAPLPLERRGAGLLWYYACSFNQVRPETEYVTYWHRRFDDHLERFINFKGRRGKVSEQSGRYKAYRMPLNIMLLPRLEWYAVGNLDAVQELCQGVAAIGKKPAQGYGIVERWDVKPWDDDWSVIGHGGALMRSVPELELPAGVDVGTCQRRIYGLRPPYWRRENQAEVWMP